MQFRVIAVYAPPFLSKVLATEAPYLFAHSLTRPATGGGRRQALHAAHCPSSVGQGASLNPLDFGVLLSHRIPSRDFPYQAINICNKLLARLSDLTGEVITHYDFSGESPLFAADFLTKSIPWANRAQCPLWIPPRKDGALAPLLRPPLPREFHPLGDPLMKKGPPFLNFSAGDGPRSPEI